MGIGGRHIQWAFRPIVLLTAAVVLPLLVFAAAQAVNALRQQQELTQRAALESVRALSDKIDAELARHIDLVQTAAALPAFDIGADAKVIPDVLRRISALQPLWISALVATPDGVVSYSTSNPQPHPVNDRTSLDASIAARAAVIGNITKGVNGQLGLPIRAPIVRDGKVLGALTAVIRTTSIQRVLTQAHLPDDWQSAVIDAAGRRVARSTMDETFRGTPATPATLAARARGPEGVYETEMAESGEAGIAAYRVSPTTNWSVHVAIPRDVYEAPLNRLRWLIVSEAAAALLLAVAFTVLLARELSMRRNEVSERERAERMEALGRMTGRIAHDFNNLLAVISNASQNIRRRIASPEAERYAGLIASAVDRGVAITGELLLFARAGMVPLKPADINTRIRHTMGLIREAVGPDVQITLDLAETLPRANIDPVQFDLALLNLAVNAREAMSGPDNKPENKVSRLTIATKAGMPDAKRRRSVALIVSDTGAGIPQHQLPHVFEPFFTTKGMAKGSGLGLAQVYAFAKQCDGSVSMRSQIGVGSTVTMLLPEANADAADAHGVSAVPDAWSGKRVLLVDDDEGVRSVTADSLETLGFEVVEAEDAKTALACLDATSFDLLISDIMMPGGMDGIGLARQARARWPDMPTLLISGYSPSVQQAMTNGWQVIAKPFTLEILSEQIDEKLRAA
jgi:signal transduction histidine kinase